MAATDLKQFAGLKIQSPADVAAAGGSCILIHGEPGAGKTTLAAGAADSKYGSPLLVLDAEGGIKAVRSRTNIDVIEITEWLQFKKVIDEIKASASLPWKCIVVDNLSEFQDLNLWYIQNKMNVKDGRQVYRETKDQLMEAIRDLRNIVAARGITFVILGWERALTDEEGKVYRHDISLSPALAGVLPGALTAVGWLEVLEDPAATRALHFAKSSRFAAKLSVDRTDAAAAIPGTVYNPSMATLLGTLVGGEPWPTEKHRAPKGVRSRYDLSPITPQQPPTPTTTR